MLPISSPSTPKQQWPPVLPYLGQTKVPSLISFTAGSSCLNRFLGESPTIASVEVVHRARHSIGAQWVSSHFQKKWRLMTFPKLLHHCYSEIKEISLSWGLKYEMYMSFTFSISRLFSRLNYIAQSHWMRKLIMYC